MILRPGQSTVGLSDAYWLFPKNWKRLLGDPKPIYGGTSGHLSCLLNPWTPEATLVLREDIQTLEINHFHQEFNPWKSASVLELRADLVMVKWRLRTCYSWCLTTPRRSWWSEAVTPEPKGLTGLIEYSYQQIVTSFPEADLERTPKLSVLDLE